MNGYIQVRSPICVMFAAKLSGEPPIFITTKRSIIQTRRKASLAMDLIQSTVMHFKVQTQLKFLKQGPVKTNPSYNPVTQLPYQISHNLLVVSSKTYSSNPAEVPKARTSKDKPK